MATITEDYVSFEVAKLLKEKGFDEGCYAYWHENENRLIISQSIHAIQNVTNPCFFGPAAPTLQMAMKWLREVHNLHIEIVRGPKGYHIFIVTIPLGVVKFLTREIVGTTYVDSHEEAAEAAIKYCLENLI